ncbi:hypothetical protein PAXRUDRAFT_166226 [Paxillus rubicundulus Ve08.2h10]|uniref:Uncharacterized protein n=1 Tax=Paxillus rubicundulus Ve08.2h10 TaxID=930991 RepID=A0A0D0C392_9AGAM|nr:hypothetical protein PAXRUDRAFT_166226 [Paxillus rubicundulus Ve08.2h10]
MPDLPEETLEFPGAFTTSTESLQDFIFAGAANSTSDLSLLGTIQEAYPWPDTDCWKSTVEKELLNLNYNYVYKTIPILKGVTLITSKPIFHIYSDNIKHNHTGNVKHYKVHIVTQDFTQKEGIDYQEVFTLWQTWTPSGPLLPLLQNMTWSSTKWMSPPLT